MTETDRPAPHPESSPTPQERRPPDSPPPLRKLASHDLLQGAQEILIEHAGETYRLRLTRKGKLILHK